MPIVGPNGEFMEPRCGPNSVNVGGDLIVYWSEQEQSARLTKRAQDEGYTLYSEICKDKPQYWQAYQQMLKARESGGAGAELKGLDLKKFYHPEVWRRRKASDGRGHRRIDASSIVAGLEDAPVADEDAVEGREPPVVTRGESRARAPNEPRPRGGVRRRGDAPVADEGAVEEDAE